MNFYLLWLYNAVTDQLKFQNSIEDTNSVHAHVQSEPFVASIYRSLPHTDTLSLSTHLAVGAGLIEQCDRLVEFLLLLGEVLLIESQQLLTLSVLVLQACAVGQGSTRTE